MNGFRDALSRFVFEHGAIRGAVVSLDATRADILALHPYPPPLVRVLSELLAAAALLASTLKFNGSLIVQLQSEGPLRLLVVECDARMTLRATAQWSQALASMPEQSDLAALAGGAGHGRLAITLDPKDGGPIYQGIVALEATSIATLIEHYLDASEQIPSRMILAHDTECVRGLLLQRLPGSTEADAALWQAVNEDGASVGPALLAAPDPAALLAVQFGEHDIRLFKAHAARFGCTCSQERVENALRLIGRDEVDGIVAEQGEVRVTCEFCNRAYGLSPAAARALFTPDSVDAGAARALRH